MTSDRLVSARRARSRGSRRRAPYPTDSRRSAFAARTGLHAPYLPFVIPVGTSGPALFRIGHTSDEQIARRCAQEAPWGRMGQPRARRVSWSSRTIVKQARLLDSHPTYMPNPVTGF